MITVISPERWNATGRFGRREVQAILTRSDGWHELSGTSWMAEDSGSRTAS